MRIQYEIGSKYTLIENGQLVHKKSPFQDLINYYGKEKFLFVSTKYSDYKNFQYNNCMPFYEVDTLERWFTIINSCSMLISNLTGIAVIGHSLDKIRILELPYSDDVAHIIGEEKYSKNIFWYLNEKINNLK